MKGYSKKKKKKKKKKKNELKLRDNKRIKEKRYLNNPSLGRIGSAIGCCSARRRRRIDQSLHGVDLTQGKSTFFTDDYFPLMDRKRRESLT